MSKVGSNLYFRQCYVPSRPFSIMVTRLQTGVCTFPVTTIKQPSTASRPDDSRPYIPQPLRNPPLRISLLIHLHRPHCFRIARFKQVVISTQPWYVRPALSRIFSWQNSLQRFDLLAIQLFLPDHDRCLAGCCEVDEVGLSDFQTGVFEDGGVD